ncbi:MAG: efflux RND transporter periplasmic adaptor subunit [Desulforhopalus sp.]|nr:efflux RND transporter periplasmic adaptor subunit [Desulforhopalus sp.]
MNRFLTIHGRTLLLAGFLLILLGAFSFTLLRSGPLAPVPVTLATVELREITPALFGIGTVEAQFVHKIGPTLAGRLQHIDVQPGDQVVAGQVVGGMDPVDLDDRISAQGATISRAQAAVLAVEANIREADTRKTFAKTQAERYQQLLAVHSVSKEATDIKQQDYHVAEASLAAARANLEVARQEVRRLQAERDALLRQRNNLHLIAPVSGLVTRRDADPGTTVVPGQAVVEIVEPANIRVTVRFDQQRALGLKAGLEAQIVLRSLAGEKLAGRVERLEPIADAITEEIVGKVTFKQLPHPLPPLGELAEVTVFPVPLKAMPAVHNASLQRVAGQLGVWTVSEGRLRFIKVKTGAADLDGWVQIIEGLGGGERVVMYSKKALQANSRIKPVEHKPGTPL